MECPFCRTELREGATVCPGCGAREGYIPMNNGAVGGKATVIFTMVVCVVVAFLFGSLNIPFMGIFVFLMLLYLPYAGWMLVRGPRWFR